ncbi:MAG: AAA family ATPase [Thioploca sp.]|nr:AAA family ATPase [Thioploca sp.]
MKDLDLKVLRGITEDKVTAIQFAHTYDASLFSDQYRKFSRSVLEYTKNFRTPPTINTLSDYYSKDPGFVSTIQTTFEKINQIDFDKKEFNYYISKLKKRYQVKVQKEISAEAADVDDDTPESFFKKLALKMQDVARLDLSRGYLQQTIGDYVDEFQERFKNRMEQPELLPLIKSHYSGIDELYRGLSPGELIIIGGESNSGKSMLLTNIAVQIWMQNNTIDMAKDINPKFHKGFNICYFSLEMSYDECFQRLLCKMADIPLFGLSDPLAFPLDDEQKNRMELALDFIKKYQEAGYYFDIIDVPRGLTIEEVEARYNDALLKYRPDIVVVDYMGLMRSTGYEKDADWLKVGAIAASLHEFSRAYDIACITAAQLTDIKRGSKSKEAEADKRIGMHRFGRSSLIIHHANLGIQIETRPGEKDYPDLKYHIVKNRKGPHGEGVMLKNFANASLSDLPKRQEFVNNNVKDLLSKLNEKA